MGYGNNPKKGKISAGEAAAMIKSGRSVGLSPVCAEPPALLKALVQGSESLEDVTVYTMLPMGECLYAAPGMERHFRVKAFSVGPRLMEAVHEGRAQYVPCHLSQIPGLFREGLIEVDFALVQLSPPDGRGYCSLGLSASYTQAMLEHAGTVIAEINERMPRTPGNAQVHLSQVDYTVESSEPLPTVGSPGIGEVEKRIAAYTAELVPDGAVVQVGIGNIPDAILKALAGKKNLSLHSGTFSDGVLELAASGALEAGKGRSRKPRLTAAELIGSERLYGFCDGNPLVALCPIDYTHNFNVLSKLKNLISVTAGIQIDLTGQVNAEMLGDTLINGVGGQLDFLRGAAASPGGRPIIVFPSTARKGEVSRITAQLPAGVSVTVGRADVDIVITEYGVARLKGKSLAERAEALIGIAHPDFRKDLREKARRM